MSNNKKKGVRFRRLVESIRKFGNSILWGIIIGLFTVLILTFMN